MAETKLKNKYWVGVGRRKSAVALVRIFEHSNEFTINDKKADPVNLILAPFELVGKKRSFGVSVRVKGGGKMSQLEAIRHGISRALEHFDSELRPTLKKAGFLTRDQREKERKKPGLKRARRAPQWSKR